MNNGFVLALSVLVGTIIGGGIFALPYVVSQSGIVPAIFYFILLGGAVMLLHLFFGEVCLRTEKKARLIGYCALYLGKPGKIAAVFSTFFVIVGALLAYIIVGGGFLHILIGEFFDISAIWFSILFWAFLSLFIIRGIQVIAKAELIMNIALFTAVFFIFLFAAPHVQLENFSLVKVNNLFLPYGVILFALVGWHAIPEIADFFKGRREKRNLNKLIVLAGIITVVLYFMFSFFVVGVSGNATSPDALEGLIPFLGKGVVVLGAAFGLIAIAASFLVLGNYLKNSLRYDFNLPYTSAAAIAIFSPLVFFLLGVREFVLVLGLVGIVLGVVESVLIVLLFIKAKRKGTRQPEYTLNIPQFVPYLVGAILIGGAIAQLLFSYVR